MIMLGVMLVNMIIGPSGIGEKAKSLWGLSYEYRTESFQ